MAGVYRNRWDRDIHIWSGLDMDQILAGCITQESLTYSVLYSWLRTIFVIKPQRGSSSQLEVWYLVPATEPSPGAPLIGDNSHPLAPTDQRVIGGHYAVKMFVHPRHGAAPVFIRDPEIQIRGFTPRSRLPSRANSSGGSLDSPSSSVARRDPSFRRDVRQRDGHCRLSGTAPGCATDNLGQIAHINYTGFQAAHIFPLAFAHRDDGPPDEETHFEAFRGCWASNSNITPQNAQGIADTPANGILLRADLHLFFDAYQFALLVPVDQEWVPTPPQVIRFNLSAAPLFSDGGPIQGMPWHLLPPKPLILLPTSLQPTRYQPVSTIDSINMNLFRQHLLYCIKLHVAGGGYIPDRKRRL
ncbi:hypothetical protein BS47DRAFT_1490174 [Hydnum rufescens UP504]|uniref:HNH nuclease domain-containing protein n=1 Tax=Hydnum rufescens UP504 TaxID=1448309 RepID=A0A9P6DMM7_9AGAM|nr:hypothetical protein BS47DRAFT_1490174 [Hydnum rufescens UP504]